MYLAVTLCLGVVCCFLTVLVIRINFKEQDTPISDGWRLIYDKLLVPCSCWNKRFYKSAMRKESVSSVDLKDETVVMEYDGEKKESSPEPEPSDELKWTHVATVMDHFFLVVMGIVTTMSSFLNNIYDSVICRRSIKSDVTNPGLISARENTIDRPLYMMTEKINVFPTSKHIL